MPRKQAPLHLTAESRKWWAYVVRSFELDEHHVRLLTLCCEALDRASEARQRVAADGPYSPNRHGELKAHPGISVEKDAMLVFRSLLRELDLDAVPAPQEARPPLLKRYRDAS